MIIRHLIPIFLILTMSSCSTSSYKSLTCESDLETNYSALFSAIQQNTLTSNFDYVKSVSYYCYVKF